LEASAEVDVADGLGVEVGVDFLVVGVGVGVDFLVGVGVDFLVGVGDGFLVGVGDGFLDVTAFDLSPIDCGITAAIIAKKSLRDIADMTYSLMSKEK